EPIRSLVIKAGGKKVPPWTGKIARILVEEGQQVEAHQALVEMDKRDEEIDYRLKKLISDDPSELKTALTKERTLRSLYQANRAIYDKNRSVSREDLEKKE